MPKDKALLDDILDSMRLAVAYLGGRTFEEFAADQFVIDAVVRRLEIIGEATKGLSDSQRGQHPDVPWREMAGMRDRLIHAYNRIELRLVHHAVTQVIPPLIPRLEAILASLPDPE